MDYHEAMAYMEELGKRGSVLGLQAIHALLDRLGQPQNRRPVIHVAGTNGKGSICTFLECMYTEEGRRVGRYISPTLFSYLERFQVNGTAMHPDAFAALLDRVIPVLREMQAAGEPMPTAFEVETAISFLYFDQEKVDLVILETGMGGRLDATNVVDAPLCTVFASIGMDHMQFLGSSLEQIAYQKAGIIKRGCPVVTYPNAEQVCAVLRREWEKCNADLPENPPFCEVDPERIEVVDETLTGSCFRYRGQTYHIPLAGEYQIYNAATAICAKQLTDGTVVPKSLERAIWHARFEVVSRNPLLILDGAHNMDGVEALRSSLQIHFSRYRMIYIVGILRDKEYEKMVARMCPMADVVYTVTPPTSRGLQAETLAECVRPYCERVYDAQSVADARRQATVRWNEYRDAGQQAVIVAWGSLSYMYLMGGGANDGC